MKANISEQDRDIDGARELVKKAAEHIEDAKRTANHGSSRFLLAYQAALDLMNAVLNAAGKKIGSGHAAHIVRIECCQDLMPGQQDAWDRVDDVRQRRNRITYDGIDEDVDVVEMFTVDLEGLAEHVTEFIKDQKTAQRYELEPRDL